MARTPDPRLAVVEAVIEGHTEIDSSQQGRSRSLSRGTWSQAHAKKTGAATGVACPRPKDCREVRWFRVGWGVRLLETGEAEAEEL
jgi:hypothetical protein